MCRQGRRASSMGAELWAEWVVATRLLASKSTHCPTSTKFRQHAGAILSDIKAPRALQLDAYTLLRRATKCPGGK